MAFDFSPERRLGPDLCYTPQMSKLIDLTGQQFGRLTVIAIAPKRGRRTMWQCQCSCGQRAIVGSSMLINGTYDPIRGQRTTKSCGCLRSEFARQVKHGQYGTPTYQSWRSMMKRCYQPRNISYPNCGGRGITVCEQWHDFTNFLADMGTRPAGKTIDRINNSGNYEPGNCRWATPKEQSQNSRQPHLITYAGLTLNQTEWAARIGISTSGLSARLNTGWSIERALNTPPRRYRSLPSG